MLMRCVHIHGEPASFAIQSVVQKHDILRLLNNAKRHGIEIMVTTKHGDKLNEMKKNSIISKWKTAYTLKKKLGDLYLEIQQIQTNEVNRQRSNHGLCPLPKCNGNTLKGKSAAFALSIISNLFSETIDKNKWSKKQYIGEYGAEIQYLYNNMQRTRITITDDDYKEFTIITEPENTKFTERGLENIGLFCKKLFAMKVIADIPGNNMDTLSKYVIDDKLLYESMQTISISGFDYFLPFTTIKNIRALALMERKKKLRQNEPKYSASNPKKDELTEHLIQLTVDQENATSQLEQTEVNMERLQQKYDELYIECNRLNVEHQDTIKELQYCKRELLQTADRLKESESKELFVKNQFRAMWEKNKKLQQTVSEKDAEINRMREIMHRCNHDEPTPDSIQSYHCLTVPETQIPSNSSSQITVFMDDDAKKELDPYGTRE